MFAAQAITAILGIGALTGLMSHALVRPIEISVAGESGSGTFVLGEMFPEGESIPVWVGDLVSGANGPQGGVIDLELWNFANLEQWGRIGTYPNGTSGFAQETGLCNVGDIDIPWFEAMDPRHPFHMNNLYRIRDGRLEQVGLGWAKHFWYAFDYYGCGDCDPDWADDHLNVGCQDTYTAEHNANWGWLGPRDEVDPQTGFWDPCGSHFDVGDGTFEEDCLRSHDYWDHSGVDHRMRVTDDVLSDADSRFFYEGRVVVKDDVNTWNNISWREAEFTWNGSAWGTRDVGQPEIRPFIMEWGTHHGFASPRIQGDSIVSVRVVETSPGRFRYEYAIYNHDITRGMSSFILPLPVGATVFDTGFHAPTDDEDDWSDQPWDILVQSDRITWSTDKFENEPFANSLRYSTIYTCWFESDAAPGLTTGNLDMFLPGDGPDFLTVNTIGPDAGLPSGFALDSTELRRGQVATLTADGLQQGERVHFIYATSLGRTEVAPLGVELDLGGTISYLGSGRANSRGRSTKSGKVPNGLSGTIYFQAAVGGAKSNLVMRTVTD